MRPRTTHCAPNSKLSSIVDSRARSTCSNDSCGCRIAMKLVFFHTVAATGKVFISYCSLVVALCVLSACGQSDAKKSQGAVETDAANPLPEDADVDSDSPNLALRLRVGDRFPLQKTVTTTVKQPGEHGMETSTAVKTFLLSVTVEAMPNEGPRAGQKQMGVQFHSVKFERELLGQRLEYHSRTAREPLPMVVRPYHGLVGNRFSFWLGAENQIEGIVDFKPFIERCLRDVPKDKYEEVWNNLEAQSGVYGIANFVDDSIGLLPATKVKTGENWTVTRRTQHPIPMVCKNRYTLHHLDDKQAEVSILGDIFPSAFSIDAVPAAAEKGVQLSIQGGKASGNCTIDLRTGLPIHSQVEESMDILVKLRNGQEFLQHKHTITSIMAFPNSSQDKNADELIVRQKRSRLPLSRAQLGEIERPQSRTATPDNRNPRR